METVKRLQVLNSSSGIFCNLWRLLRDFDFCRKELEEVAHAHSRGEEAGPTR